MKIFTLLNKKQIKTIYETSLHFPSALIKPNVEFKKVNTKKELENLMTFENNFMIAVIGKQTDDSFFYTLQVDYPGRYNSFITKYVSADGEIIGYWNTKTAKQALSHYINTKEYYFANNATIIVRPRKEVGLSIIESNIKINDASKRLERIFKRLFENRKSEFIQTIQKYLIKNEILKAQQMLSKLVERGKEISYNDLYSYNNESLKNVFKKRLATMFNTNIYNIEKINVSEENIKTTTKILYSNFKQNLNFCFNIGGEL